MKKISMFAVLASLTLPAIATETVAEVSETLDAIEIEQTLTQADTAYARNPKTKFPRGMQIGLGVSATSGLNGFVGYANKDFESFWWKRLGVRFDFATTSPVKSAINSAIDSALDDGVDIGDNLMIGGGELSAKHMAGLVDFYPFGNTWFAGGWRLTAGYVTGKLDLAATLTGDLSGVAGSAIEFDLAGESYRYNGGNITATADVDWKYRGPYLGTGFDLGLFWGFKIFVDAGVVFTSKTASLNLDAPISNVLEHWNGTAWESVQGIPGLETQFNDAKDLAFVDAQDELDDLKFFPMVKLGFMYRF